MRRTECTYPNRLDLRHRGSIYPTSHDSRDPRTNKGAPIVWLFTHIRDCLQTFDCSSGGNWEMVHVRRLQKGDLTMTASFNAGLYHLPSRPSEGTVGFLQWTKFKSRRLKRSESRRSRWQLGELTVFMEQSNERSWESAQVLKLQRAKRR